MYSTRLPFIKHKPTNRKKKKNIYFLDSFNVQKGLGKIIHIKEDQADFIENRRKYCLFFLSLFFFTIDQSPKVSIYMLRVYLFPDFEVVFLWLSVSLSQGLYT